MFIVQQVSCTEKTRKVFRQVSRESSGAAVQPMEGEVMFFGCDADDKVVSVASLLLADPKPETWDENVLSGESCEDWDAELASSCTTAREWDCCSGNKLTFLFVLPRCQRRGYGRQMLEFVEGYAWTRSSLPVKLESSRRGLNFFTRRGYIAVGDPIECTHPSSSLFRSLQKMIKIKSVHVV